MNDNYTRLYTLCPFLTRLDPNDAPFALAIERMIKAYGMNGGNILSQESPISTAIAYLESLNNG